ncbi:vWA domain-containing protein [Deinococcus depolymerans]|uniref:VWFA domain-containing protein n=1 Tax=Deinococcus depolymerans TaxID=392408 RepID=A0ABP3LEU5_9DEIO
MPQHTQSRSAPLSLRPPRRSLGALLGLSLLASCGGPAATPAPTTPTATTMQLNGTRVLGPAQVQFGVTPLNGTQTVSGTLSNPSVTFSTAGVSGAVSVCGQVTVQNTVTAAVTLDATGSMTTTDPNEKRRDAARAFVGRLTGGSQAAVLSFEASSTPSAGMIGSVLHQDLTADQALLNTAIDRATYARGSTNFYDAVIDAVKVASRAGRPGPIVLALTDGIDNRSSNSPDNAIAAAKAAGVPVYTIGLDATGSLDFTEMERIASETGGLFRSNVAAGDLDAYFSQLYNAFTAQGCLELNLAAAPAPGTTVAGTLWVDVTDYGKATSRLSVPFSYAVRDSGAPK